jgi:hypothetical protein
MGAVHAEPRRSTSPSGPTAMVDAVGTCPTWATGPSSSLPPTSAAHGASKMRWPVGKSVRANCGAPLSAHTPTITDYLPTFPFCWRPLSETVPEAPNVKSRTEPRRTNLGVAYGFFVGLGPAWSTGSINPSSTTTVLRSVLVSRKLGTIQPAAASNPST